MKQEQVWDTIAKEWNNYRNKKPQEITEFLHNKKGTIIDIGCGSGRNIQEQKELTWHALDFSKEMIHLTKKNHPQTTTKQAQAWNTGYKDETFDYAILYAVLHCIETQTKRKKTLQELYRILKPKGQAIISTWNKQSPRLQNKTKECKIPWTTKKETVQRYTYIYEKKELEEEIKQTGFKILTSKENENITLTVQKPLQTT